MEVIKKTDAFTIVKKRSGRYGVKNVQGKWLNADKKVEILLSEGLLKKAATLAKASKSVSEVETAPALEPAPEPVPAPETEPES